MTLLSPGDRFPALTVNLLDGESLELPDAFAGGFGVVLVNRGAWCPFCTGQLRAFQRAAAKLDDAGIRVVSLSVDSEETVRGLVAENGLEFPVGHSADADAVSESLGAFVNQEPKFLQATGFVLDPEGRVLVSVYSSGAIGRLLPDDVVGLVTYAREHATA